MITIQETKLTMGLTLTEALQLHRELHDLPLSEINSKPRLLEIFSLLDKELKPND